GEAEGAVSADGRVMGSYLHGMFSGDSFREAFLRQLGATPSATSYAASVEDTLDRLAAHVEAHLDVDGLLAVAR
ncbi:MAG: cobyric acid synthase CobQ, partial [Hyphomicrobium sp.]|nr:cobyric acid synthase CobQ [Hyphomicrobium sp.]